VNESAFIAHAQTMKRKQVVYTMTGGLPVVYAVGLHHIEQSLLTHAIFFLQQKKHFANIILTKKYHFWTLPDLHNNLFLK